MKEILRVTDLSHAFNGTAVLSHLSFSLLPGERLAILGPSGSGKTTLLRLLAGLEAPQHGEIAILEQAASRAGEVLIAPAWRQVAMVFQGLALFPQLNALEQIAFAAGGRGGTALARQLLERIGLAHRAAARLDELSGGERQRIALARALAQEPKIILMDEPFASLDDVKRAEMRDLLRALLEARETTLILVTHSRDDAFDLARSVLVLEGGRARAFGPLEAVLVRPRYAAVVRTLGLGELLEAELTGPGVAETAFGKVSTPATATRGRVQLLVRPGQPVVVAGPDGVEAEVVSIELRSPERQEVRRVAVVRARGASLRMLVPAQALAVGDHIRVRITGECELIED